MHYHMIGNRQFLRILDESIPVDLILDIDWEAPNGGCDNSVRIRTTERKYYYAYENADAVREFFGIKREQE